LARNCAETAFPSIISLMIGLVVILIIYMSLAVNVVDEKTVHTRFA
jgi:hypothetical protein